MPLQSPSSSVTATPTIYFNFNSISAIYFNFNLFQFPAIFCRPLLVRPICDNFQ